MPYKRRYRKRKTYRKRRTYRRKRRGKYGTITRRRTKKEYKNRQQLLSVKTVKAIARKIVKGYPESMTLVRSPIQFYNNAGNYYKPLVDLTYPPAGANTLTYDTPNVYKYRALELTDVINGTGLGQYSGDSFLVKAIMWKFRFQWFVKAGALPPHIKWYLVQTPAVTSISVDSPYVNGNLFKNDYFSPSEREFSSARRKYGYKIIKKGRFYPPRNTRGVYAAQLPVSNSFPKANTNPVMVINQSLLEEATDGVNLTVNPYVITKYTEGAIYWKINKKCKMYNLPVSDGVLDIVNTGLKSATPYRTFLVMYKHIYPVGTANQNTVNNVTVATQKTMYWSDD